MGAEAQCSATAGGKTSAGRALLETDELIFRGDDGLRLVIPFKSVTRVRVEGARLVLERAGGEVAFELGKSAEKWAEKIRKPKGVGEKLGVKPGARVVLAGAIVAGSREVLAECGADVEESAKGAKGADAVFVGVAGRAELSLIAKARKWIKPDGAVWVLRPKGSADVSESDVMAAGRNAGLKDVKVVRFSESHSAEKFVIPVSER